MHRGYVKLFRKFIEWEWYDDINTKILFLHILLKANHKDKKYRGQIIKRGTFLTGREELAKQTGLSVQNVRTSLERLKSTSEITINKSGKGSVITIVNYDLYHDDNQQDNQEVTSNQPASNQQVTTTKNVKNVKNVKNDNINTTPFQKIVDLYHDVCVDLQQVQKLTEKRKGHLNQLWKICDESIEVIETYFRCIHASDFLCFRTPRKNDSVWKATFDWCINKNNYIKVMEGGYENRHQPKEQDGGKYHEDLPF